MCTAHVQKRSQLFQDYEYYICIELPMDEDTPNIKQFRVVLVSHRLAVTARTQLITMLVLDAVQVTIQREEGTSLGLVIFPDDSVRGVSE